MFEDVASMPESMSKYVITLIKISQRGTKLHSVNTWIVTKDDRVKNGINFDCQIINI